MLCHEAFYFNFYNNIGYILNHGDRQGLYLNLFGEIHMLQGGDL